MLTQKDVENLPIVEQILARAFEDAFEGEKVQGDIKDKLLAFLALSAARLEMAGLIKPYGLEERKTNEQPPSLPLQDS